MREYKTGDICPCCGQPIGLTDPQALRLFAVVMDMLGLDREEVILRTESKPDEDWYDTFMAPSSDPYE